MPSYYLTRDAQSDLIEIHQFTLQKWGFTQTRKYLSELRKTMKLLAETPSLGKFRPDVGSNVLSFPYISHVIYYVVHKQHLVVFALLHKRMVPNNHLNERELI